MWSSHCLSYNIDRKLHFVMLSSATDWLRLNSIKCYSILMIANFLVVANGLKLLQVSIPPLKLTGQNARLACLYDLEGDALYSIKWYKGGREFFRYVQRDQPPMQVFPVDGVTVDKSQSDQFQVTLLQLTVASAGRYKCEVSVDAPSFQTSFSTVEMNIVALPEFGPRINSKGILYFDSNNSAGGKNNNNHHHRSHHSYYSRRTSSVDDQIDDDEIQINCTSNRSKPAAELHWYVNGFKVNGDNLIEYAPFIDDDVNNNSTMLETAVLGLVWKLPSAGVQGEMITDAAAIVFNCTAAVGSVYWSSTSLTLSPEPGSGINVKSRPMLMYHGSHLSADALPTTRKSTSTLISLLFILINCTAHYY